MPRRSVLILGGQGYIGSALTAHLQAASYSVSSVDLGLRGTPQPSINRVFRFQDLEADELGRFSAVVLLAGHSSVTACENEPVAAFANNVQGLVDLVSKLRDQVFIFASTISVYVDTHGIEVAEDVPLPKPVSLYDFHKQVIEGYAALAYPMAIGLRLGTVCGPSPNIRDELLLNNLVRSAVRDGKVEVANREVHRPVLGIGDLCRAVETLLAGTAEPGCYNLASANVRIGEAAEIVGRRFGVPVAEVERPNRYDVQVDTARFCCVTGFRFRDTVESIVESLAKYFQPDLANGSLG